MATIFRTRSNVEERSGGKITRSRRIAAARTPYDRPPPPPPSSPPSQNPSWLTGVVFPATRMIANGAGKLISSVFGPESSSSSSDSDSDSECDEDDENDDYDTHAGVDGLNKNLVGSSPTAKCLKEPQPTVWKDETKRVIEKLLMQETFTREERDRLINLINSRVGDCSTVKRGEDGKLCEIPSRTVGDDRPDICSKAVMEARKWLEGKKVGSSPKSDLDHGPCTFNSAELPHVAEGEGGSPVDMAKSYMRARPPWASPSISPIDLRTPSSVGIELFKEETPYSAGFSSLSSSKHKRNSLATGSWNIQDELRRVRSKATEDMLRTLPSKRIDMSSFAEPRSTLSFSTSLDGGGSSSHVMQVLEMTKDCSSKEAFSSIPAIGVSEQIQSIQIIEGGGAASKSHISTDGDFAPKKLADSRSSERNLPPVNEVNEPIGHPTANGFPSSTSGLSGGAEAVEKHRTSDEENPNPVKASDGKTTKSVPVEETCELLSEASVEVPVINETNSVGSGSQNSSSMHHEEPSQEQEQEQEQTQLIPKRSLGGKRKQQQGGRRLSTYNKRGKGRGK